MNASDTARPSTGAARICARCVCAVGLAALLAAHSALTAEDAKYLRLVPIPPGVNAGYSGAVNAFMLELLGEPGALAPDCANETRSASLAPLLVTEDIGRFRVTGLRAAVVSVRGIFAKVRADNPDLYAHLGSGGMLCIRAVRGHLDKYSNHAWGVAIDVAIDGHLIPLGSNRTYAGLLALYPYFHAAKFVWGAGFRQRDPMHFEASRELLQEWQAAGALDP